MENSSRYRKPPLRRTRDSFIDDKNLQQQPRVDFGKDRGSQIRRDKDKVRNVGVTLYDIDFAIKSFIDKTMQLKIEDNLPALLKGKQIVIAGDEHQMPPSNYFSKIFDG